MGNDGFPASVWSNSDPRLKNSARVDEEDQLCAIEESVGRVNSLQEDK